ncbi:MAG: hypothetical protein HY606_13975 [Planctomycetes bacterium]|nr:hypothetical protein [Planctomycetota bacterium]
MTRRFIFLLVAIVMILPMYFQFSIGKVHASPSTKGYYNAIEKIPEGSTVLVSFDFDPGSKPEIEPTARATIWHLLRRNVKIVCMSLWETAPVLAVEILGSVTKQFEKQTGKKIEYGKDWCYLGFRPGKYSVIVGLGESIYTQYRTDFYGKKTDELPIMKDIKSLKDFPLLIDFGAGNPGPETWIQMATDKFKIDFICATTAVVEPTYQQYISTGQLKGMVGAMRGAGEYEQLVGINDKGTAGVNAISLGQLLIVVLIILGNILKK